MKHHDQEQLVKSRVFGLWFHRRVHDGRRSRSAHCGTRTLPSTANAHRAEHEVEVGWGYELSESAPPPMIYLLSKPPSLKSSTASHKQCHKPQGTKFSNVWAQRGQFLFKLSHKICGRFRYFQGDESSFGGSSRETQLLVYGWLRIFLSVGMSSSLAKSMWGRNRSLLSKLEHLNKPWCSVQPDPPLILLQEDEQRVWLFQSVRDQLLANYRQGRRLVFTPVTADTKSHPVPSSDSCCPEACF